MTVGALPGVDAAALAAGLVAFVIGYGVGMLRLSWYVARGAGATALTERWRDPGPAGVWRVAGPGPGMLALTGELAKGVVPVAIGLVTWSWGVGWLAGLGAVLGACRPSFGRRVPAPTHPSVGLAVLAGAATALAPAAAAMALLVAAIVAGVLEALGRSAARPALIAGVVTYPVVLLAVAPDPGRAVLAVILCLVPITTVRTTRGHPERDERPSI